MEKTKIPFNTDEKLHEIYTILNVANDDFSELKQYYPIVIERIKNLLLLKQECDNILPILKKC